ncbi:MAG: FAD-dependent oxidoreductase [Bacteroidales bacterium]|nr:FAD-dependent oxidoreductase [Bacteroidales bacterium]MCF8404324.1 FAD-dependent oxidoreductase [Bacteroidales bacterium]
MINTKTSATALNASIVEEFKNQLRGNVILPADKKYNKSRKVYNAMIDKHPGMIAKCTDVTDVIAAVNFGRTNNLLVSVRGGGHNAGGLGICDDGLVIDLSLIRFTHIDAKAKTIRVGGGCQWGDVDHAGHSSGLAVPTGIISTTGVGGLTLGGGLGYLTLKHGLTIDNLISAEMVLADGTKVTASADENKDLYWGIRGGGGNFGIVTSFLFKAHPVHTIYGGPTLWSIDKTEEIMKWYRDFILRAPKELYGFFALLTVPGPPFPEAIHGKKMCGIIWSYTGPMEKAKEAFKPILAMKPDFEHVGEMPHPTLNSMFDQFYPSGLQWYWRADFIDEIPNEAVSLHAKFGQAMPTPHSTMHLYPIFGEAHNVGDHDTPWAYRKANWAQVIVGVDPDKKNNEKLIKWTKDYYDAIHPYSSGGAYINFMMDEGQERVMASYGVNYNRLTEVKRKYDPENFFRVNQNIEPQVNIN